jgi:dienelactone hydrolase
MKLILICLMILLTVQAQELSVSPQRALIDEPLDIILSGLMPGNEVVLRAEMVDDEGVTWSSTAVFAADDDGGVEVATQAPVEGTYQGADAMGLFWSMEPDAAPTAGIFFPSSLEPLQVTLTAEVDGQTVASAELERRLVAPDVTRTEVREDGLVGTLFVPPGAGPHPAIVVLGGSEGGLDESTAALLASRGYAALAIAYFGTEELPEELIEIPIETFYDALDWVAAHESVDPARLALFGASKGAEAALLVASRRADVQAVVAYVPSDVVWQGISFDPMATPRSSWREGNEGVPFVPYMFTEEMFIGMQPGDPMILEPMYRYSLEMYEGDAALIPVDQIEGSILLISAGDDQLWPSQLMAERVLEQLSNQEAEHLTFEEAGHIILAPNLPTYGTEVIMGMVMGGTPAANAEAAAVAWRRLLEFLEASFR